MIEAFRYRVRTGIGRHAWLFFPIYRLDGRRRPLMVNRDTDLVIEGFPRSGNTFVVLGFEAAQGSKVQVAHHQHAPSQIRRAVSMKIPVCVLIRRPLDAVRSLTVMFPGISFKLGLKTYQDFYEDIYGLKDSFVIATFEEATSDLGSVVRRINSRFSTDFVPFVHSEAAIEDLYGTIDRLTDEMPLAKRARSSARPTADKEVLRTQVSAEASEQLIRAADDLYERYERAAAELEG